MTLVHIVLFKFRPEVTDEHKRRFVTELKKLKNLPCVKSGRLLVGGPSVTDPIDRSKGFQIALVSYHENLAALAEYQASKEHHDVTSTYMFPYKEDLVRFDFEVEEEDEYMCEFPRRSRGKDWKTRQQQSSPVQSSTDRASCYLRSVLFAPTSDIYMSTWNHRCDGNEPSCSSCLKAGVSCVNDGKQEVTRRYISNMENRIRWLESIVKENCANVDLGLEHRMIAAENAVDHDSTILSAEIPHEDDPTTSSQRIPPRELRREARGASRNEGNGSNSLPDQHPPHHMTGSNAEHQPAHEIGLVSLSSGEGPRYIGPSSGYFFANRIFSSAGRRCKSRGVRKATAESTILSTELLSSLTLLPTRKESAVELSKKYFRTVHLIYPFLHEPTHMSVIDRVYTSQNENPLDLFQVYMVLSISALNLSRECKVHLPVEGYYASAMKYVEQVCSYGSITALQCMLLLMVYALHNPSSNVNIWNLNYQCLASVIDLGLQRDVRVSPSLGISLLDQEMRTRIFWVVYTLDRAICTMMGRPIGIRDEACEMRFPLDMTDTDLLNPDSNHNGEQEPPSHMSHSIHLFKLAKMNSEIKYVMHSIQRDVPSYAYPPVRDIFAWQRDMISTLKNWQSTIPQDTASEDTMSKLCTARYHETMVLLLRPSPAIPDPSEEMLDLCFHQAVDLLKIFGDIYRAGSLLYSRLLVHSVFLGALVLLYCIWKLPRTTAKVRVDELMSSLTMAQNILSSIGEHWSEATRARDCIDELSRVTIERLLRNRSAIESHTEADRTQSRAGALPQEYRAEETSYHFNLFDDLLQGDYQGWSGMPDIDGLMWEVFNSSPQ
ncbi:fungal-specific transcription factor domain-domain-containing protein [Aspergillus welwitschiae]|uniref:Fungal-specific transcription factor domain-domain-containing protein n=1 Tax=Aspergillus welwitschiae TaxID=1341132 RepID=A0A3F3QA11_9EURO|nr:fungal-specific transcription factor domain-domain-containing protein [Aspergillus welwitschiae]RDH36041.1 fungal-specific transcription factor domain-domain-containing protein [Aspergillus welwitschiae]